MSYTIDQNSGEIVISGFEKGIADSPYQGIGNIRNLNVRYYSGVAYMNYKRQACTISGGTLGKPLWYCESPAGLIYISDDNRQIWKQSAVNSSTFNLLTGNDPSFGINGLAFWNNYLFSLGDTIIEICGDGTGDAGVTSGNWNSPAPTKVTFTVNIGSPAVFTLTSHGLAVNDVLQFYTSGTLPTGLNTAQNFFVISAGLTANNFEVSGTLGGSVINTSGSQSGTQQFSILRGVWPIKETPLTLSASPIKGDVSATLFSYTDGSGVTCNVWNGPTGNYRLDFTATGQSVVGSLVQGSPIITWFPQLNKGQGVTTTCYIRVQGSLSSQQTGVNHMSLVTNNTGDLYYTNQGYISGFILGLFQTFNKNDMNTFSFNIASLALPQTETATWLMELASNMIIVGKYTIYQWDFTSLFWGIPVPIYEQMTKGINILNTLYIFAGNKGNIYTSNGYSISPFKKMPDYIAGVIDPAWTIGGIMQHRQRLVFQATAINSASGSVIMSGIFSLGLVNASSSIALEQAGSLVMDNQNSVGLTPVGSTGGGVLIDATSIAINYDKYFSAYGATTSSIDFNDTTLYSSNEAVIETDIIPVGGFDNPKSFTRMEFKLDQPMQSGDSISVYIRNSLSDTYTLVGTTTTAILSDLYAKFPKQKFQWVQFKITMSCNSSASSSSFNRLRQITIT